MATPDVSVLISCVGRQANLVRQFLTAFGPHGRTLACDTDPWAAGCAAASKGFLAPSVHDSKYSDWMLTLCDRERVTLLLTLLPEDLFVLEQIRPALHAKGVCLVGMDAANLRICMDKYLLYKFCKSIHVKAPPTWPLVDVQLIPDDAFPLLAKQKAGKASRGQILLSDRSMAERFCAEMVSDGREGIYLLQLRLVGQEFGLDVVNDLKGNHVTTFIRRKIRMRDGETEAAETVLDERLSKMGRTLAEHLGHQGSVDVDVIRQTDGDYLLDINPRLGGGYIFSQDAGANLPAALLAWRQGDVPDPNWLAPTSGIVSARVGSIQRLRASTDLPF